MPQMSYKVLLTHSAERDLEAIYDYIAENDTQASANYVLDKLMEVAESLAAFDETTSHLANPAKYAGQAIGYPERDSYPKELLALGIREYRQAHFKPYRLIYRVSGKQVIIYIIADGRRDMQTLLTRRMLGV
jgi:toxin ParE1/3/4